MNDSTFGRHDVYQAVTDKIIQAIEAGAGKFVMPWHGPVTAQGRPTNGRTHVAYRGVNVLTLWSEAMLRGYRSRYWATYRQWQDAGHQVRRGERGTQIIFYRTYDQDVEEGMAERPFQQWVARSSHVFNEDQLEDQRCQWAPAVAFAESLKEAEELVIASRATIRFGSFRACYRPADDLIEMPDRDWFVGSPTSHPIEAYYSTLLHELTHWTGAKHRLNREFGSRFGDDAYATEELVAELGAAFLCAELEITNDPRPDHAAYLAGWLRVLKADRRSVFAAARHARAAATTLLCLWEDTR